MFFSRIDSSASMSSQKKARGLPGMKEGPLVQMLDRQRVKQMRWLRSMLSGIMRQTQM